MRKLYKGARKVSYIISWISMIGLCASVLLTIVDIFFRLFLNKSILGVYEITQVMFVCIVFASYAFTQTEKGHINVVFALRLLPQKPRMILYTFTSLLSTIVSGFVCWASFRQTNSTFLAGYKSVTCHIPLYPFYAFTAIMLVLFTFVLLLDTIESGIAIFDKEYAEEVESTWS